MNFLEKLLLNFNLNIDEYNKKIINNVDYAFLDSFKNNIDLEKSVKILNDSINNNEKILIYGDYDCDGILSTAIIYLAIKLKKYNSFYYIPKRKNDGYGLTLENAEKIVKSNYNLVILVDNGITLNEQINYLKNNGLKVLIIDHHEIKEKIPNADSIIHWKLSNIASHNISAGALSFIFSYFLLNEVNEYLLTLGAISILSDSMPLIDLNRNIVRLGIDSLNNNKFNKIINLFKNKKEKYDEDDLNSQFIPKINSIGRLINDNTNLRIVKYLVNDNQDDELLIDWINHNNEERKKIINDFDYNLYINNDNVNFLILNIEEGLIGLVANKVLDITKKPTFILTKSNDIYKGSARILSKHGNLSETLSSISDLLITYGGHSQAAGFTIKEENINIFKNKLNELFLNQVENYNEKYVEISYQDLNFENFKILNSFKPFGQDFKKPLFIIKNISTKSFTFSKDNNHIIMKVGKNSKILYFSFPKEILDNKYVDLIGNIEKTEFKSLVSIDFKSYNYIVSKEV